MPNHQRMARRQRKVGSAPRLRFHKTLLDEFFRVAFRKKVYDTPDALQTDLDEWMVVYNELRTHQGRWCFGKTPMQTFLDSAAWAREKQNLAKAA